METRETSETIIEAAHEEKSADERFRRRAAVGIGVLAMLLAIATLGGEKTARDMVNDNILASDTWAFFQAKNIRQTSNQLAADQLEFLLAAQPNLAADVKAKIESRIARYKGTVARYDSEPDPKDPTNPLKGEGKKELTIRAREYEQRRDHAAEQLPSFEYAQALFQIGIVLGSVSIVAASRPLFGLGVGLGVVAILLMLNGFFLFTKLSHG